MNTWPRVALGRLCQVSRATISPEDPDYDDLPSVGLEQVESVTGTITLVAGSRTGDGRSVNFRFNDRHVLYGKLRPYLNKVATPDFSGRCSTELVPLLPTQGIDRGFLAAMLRQATTVQAVMAANTGSRMPRTDMNVLLSLQVPCPPIAEQQRIVDILERAASIRRLRRQAQVTAGQIIPALFTRMFGDPGGNPMGWPLQPLAQLGSLERGRSRHRPRNDPFLLGGPYPLIQTGDVASANWFIKQFKSTYSELGLQQSRLWPSGTLCITIAANIANSAILQFDACFPDSIVGFTPGRDVSTFYVKACFDFLRNGIERLAPQLAQKNINLEILSQIPLPVPPMGMQEEFAQRVKVVARIADRQSAAEITCDAASHAIQSRLFTA